MMIPRLVGYGVQKLRSKSSVVLRGRGTLFGRARRMLLLFQSAMHAANILICGYSEGIF
jgi:hypothetical protein